MLTVTVFGVVVGVFSIIGVFASVWAVVVAIKQGKKEPPKRKLEWEATSTRLVVSHSKRLTVLVDGQAVEDPHVNTVKLSVKTDNDIPSSTFDNAGPVSIAVAHSGKTVPLENTSSGLVLSDIKTSEDQADRYDVTPQLMRHGATASATFVTSGKPNLKVTSSLIDVPVVNGFTERKAEMARRIRRSNRQSYIMIGVIFGLCAAFIVAISTLQ